MIYIFLYGYQSIQNRDILAVIIIEIMLSVIDTPKSKSVTIAYQAFKSIVLCLVVILIINTISSSQDDLKEIDTQCAS